MMLWKCANCPTTSPWWTGAERFRLCVSCEQKERRATVERAEWRVFPTVESRWCPDCGGLLISRRNRETGAGFLGCCNFPPAGTLNLYGHPKNVHLSRTSRGVPSRGSGFHRSGAVEVKPLPSLDAPAADSGNVAGLDTGQV